MSKLWFYAHQGTSDKKGPVPEETIRLMMTSGELKPADLVWSEGMGNWAPLSSVAELQARAAAPVATTAFPAPAAAAPQAAPVASVVPAGLAGWTTFVGVMNIIGGIFQCIGCITLIVGIPMIMSGAALLAAKNLLPTLQGDASLAAFLEKVKKFMVMTGMVYILGFVFFIVVIVINIGMIAAGLQGKIPPPQ